jgi:DNA-binding NarL/FixJ family response regulator
MENLTTREREIADYARRGLSNKQIALALKISEGTVKAHLHSVFSKLGVTGRVQLVIQSFASPV